MKIPSLIIHNKIEGGTIRIEEKVGHTAEVTFCDGKQFKTSGPWDPAPCLLGAGAKAPIDQSAVPWHGLFLEPVRKPSQYTRRCLPQLFYIKSLWHNAFPHIKKLKLGWKKNWRI